MTSEREEKSRMRDVPVEWEALEDAFENNAPEVHSYLHLCSGEVLRVVDGIADPEMHSRIAADSNYLRIESVSSREQYRWMERFIQMVDNPPLRAALAEAIDGKGAFRRFKDVLMAHGDERERWFVFRSERLRVFMEAWLSAHAIAPVARPEIGVEPEQEQASPESASAGPPRKTRSAEFIRRQIREIAESLSARDLDKILAFAEFIRTRRIARGNSSKAEPSVVDEPVPEVPEPAAASASESEPPNSEPRKMIVVR